MMSLFFTGHDVHDFDSAVVSDTGLFSHYFHKMLANGVYLAPSQFETSFVSAAHDDTDIEKTIEANYLSLKSLK